MYVLYAFAALFFGLSYILFKLGKKALGNVFITLALFLNPLGYDLVVYVINSFTNDYWMTMSIMYTLTVSFFGLFLYFYNINPIKLLTYKVNKTHNKIKTKIRKK
jgi:hypothetical protein